jgi:hypothetical protein
LPRSLKAEIRQTEKMDDSILYNFVLSYYSQVFHHDLFNLVHSRYFIMPGGHIILSDLRVATVRYIPKCAPTIEKHSFETRISSQSLFLK